MLKFFTFRLLDAVIASSVAQRKELSYPALRGSVRKDDPLKKGRNGKIRIRVWDMYLNSMWTCDAM